MRLMDLCERNGVSPASLLSNLPGTSSDEHWKASKRLEKILDLTKSGNNIPDSIRSFLNSRNTNGEIALDRLWRLCQENDPLHNELIDVRTFKSILRSLLPPTLYIDNEIEALIIKFSVIGTSKINYVNLCTSIKDKSMYSSLDSPYIHDLQSSVGGGNTIGHKSGYVLPIPLSSNLSRSYGYNQTNLSTSYNNPQYNYQSPTSYNNSQYNSQSIPSYTNTINNPIQYIRDLIHNQRWKGISKQDMMNFLSKYNPEALSKIHLREMINNFNVPLNDTDRAV